MRRRCPLSALAATTSGMPKTEREATALVHAAIDGGITFMDNAWEYNEGTSEIRMGKAIKDRRDRVFLMTKVCTHGRDAQARHAAARGVTPAAPHRLPGPVAGARVRVLQRTRRSTSPRGGVIEALTRAREQGKVRYIGFTGHKDPEIHLAMLRARFSVRQLPAAAEWLRRDVPQLRAACPPGAGAARHCRNRDEEPRRRRQGR